MRRLLHPMAVTVVLTIAPVAAWACSGPGARAAIDRASRIGALSFLLVVAMAIAGAVVLWRRGRRRRALAPGLLAGLHPALWLSALSGDCGALLQLAAIAVALLAPVVLLLSLRGTRPGPAVTSPG